jgi:putative ABC transport system permease protein
VLLHGGALLVHGLLRLVAADPGFDRRHVLSFQLDLPSVHYGTENRQRFFAELLTRIARQPGVMSAGAISRLPILQPGAFRSRFRPAGQDPGGPESSIGVRVVSPGYFRTMNIPVLLGRGLSEQDRPGSEPTAVVNQAAVERFFPGENPLGKRLTRFSYDPIENVAEAFTVVGVVADVRSGGLGAAPQPEAYFAHAQVALPQMFIVMRADGDPIAQLAGVRNQIGALDANLPVIEPRTLDQVVGASLNRPRFFAGLLTLLSLVALVLAAVGVFGLLSFAVARRTREIGLRVALGAHPAALAAMIVREAVSLVAVGVGIGAAGAVGIGRVVRSEFAEVAAFDPVAVAGVIVVLGGTAVIASLIPAWRAAAVDPVRALRTD